MTEADFTFRYAAFLSYATRPDASRARSLEGFLESIHLTRTSGGTPISPLQICRDGSDFRLPKNTQGDASLADSVWQIIEQELARSKFLVVLCSPAATRSTWVEREVAWFRKNRGEEFILLAVVEGPDPTKDPESVFPVSAVSAGLHMKKIWYDLRGGTGPASTNFHDFDDERIRLASDLLDWDPGQRGNLLAAWQREQRATARRKLAWVSAAGIILCIVAIVALVERAEALSRLRDAQVLSFDILTLSGKFEQARLSLEGVELRDDRLRLADWIARQHAPLRSTTSKVLNPRGINGLAFDHQAKTLVTLADGRVSLVSPTALTELASGASVGVRSEIATGATPGVFYAPGQTDVERWTVVDGALHRVALPLPGTFDEVRWLERSAVGIGLRNHEAIGLRDYGDRISVTGILAQIENAVALAPAPDRTAVGLVLAPTKDEQDSTDGQRGIGTIFVADSQSAVLRQSPHITFPFRGRLIGDNLMLSHADLGPITVTRLDDGLKIQTRNIFYKPWLGLVIASAGGVAVQEVGDTDLDAVARISYLDLATGRDLHAGAVVDEPIWAYACDSPGTSAFFAGQSGRITSVTGFESAVQSWPFQARLDSPFRWSGGKLWVREGDGLHRNVRLIDMASKRVESIESFSPDYVHTLPNGGYLTYQNYPFSFALSPDGVHVAVGGDKLRIIRVPDGFKVGTDANTAFDALAKNAAKTDRAECEVDNSFIDVVRWLDNSILIYPNGHGALEMLDIRTGMNQVVPLNNDAVTSLTPRGKILVSTLSGRIWAWGRENTPEFFAQVNDLRKIFPLDADGRFFAAKLENPARTGLLVRHKDGCQEIASITNAPDLLDAAVVEGHVVLLYPTAIHWYPLPLP